MMDQRSTGIILRTRPLTETSLIVQWLTPEFGRIRCVAKGARRPKSPFLGKLDLFFEGEFSFRRAIHSDLHTLKELRLIETHAPLRMDVAWLRQASYFAVLIERTTEPDTPLPELHGLMQEALRALPRCPANPKLVLAFELRLLDLLGLGPDLTALSPEGRHAALSFGRAEEFQGMDLPITARVMREIDRLLRNAIGAQLERLPEQRRGAMEGCGD